MKTQIPQFEPSPFLWTRIEGRLNATKEQVISPVWGWSLTVAVVVLFVMSVAITPSSAPTVQNDYSSMNVLYYE